MPGKEIKGRSARANYRHGGRIGFKHGTKTPMKSFEKDFPGGGPHQTLEGKRAAVHHLYTAKDKKKLKKRWVGDTRKDKD